MGWKDQGFGLDMEVWAVFGIWLPDKGKSRGILVPEA